MAMSKSLSKTVFSSVQDYTHFNLKRTRILAGKEGLNLLGSGGVAYYMHRDQRVQDNWAAIFAQTLAQEHKLPLFVLAGLNGRHPDRPEATRRALDFSLGGLREVESECKRLNIQFCFLEDTDRPMYSRILSFMKENDVRGLVCDFSPLRPHRAQIDLLKDEIEKLEKSILYQVDAHNIVPVWVASNKQEFRAYEMRLKITPKFQEFFTHFPKVTEHPYTVSIDFPTTDWDKVAVSLPLDESVAPIIWAKPGSSNALKRLKEFIEKVLEMYGEQRNIPTEDSVSNLSPWLHYGQISAQRAVIEVKNFEEQYFDSVQKFVDEIVTWKEMSDNYCFHNENYDNLKGAPDWARETLDKHRLDQREYVYTKEQFDNAETHDKLWNAAQVQLKSEGKMHGFMRMYWAKKILEWSKSPEDAIEFALYFNDHYSIDGADANGFAGVMWSIAGVHDPPKWGERPVIGKIRWMTYQGCTRKFDVHQYVHKYLGESEDNSNEDSLSQPPINKFFKPASANQSRGRGSGRVQGSWGGKK